MTAATPSPNIWGSPRTYEVLNRAADPDGMVVGALDRVLTAQLDHPVVRAVDVGCGSGFHLPMLAARAATVVGVEPHPSLVGLSRRRVHRAHLDDRVSVTVGSAQHLPLEDASVDLVFSHWAYFFGPGCEPGLAEVDRVLRPGGLQVAVDLDVSASTGYARWFAESGTGVRSDRVADFFADPWRCERLDVVWSFADRSDLAAVLAIEFPPRIVGQALAETVGSTIAVPTVLRWRPVTLRRRERSVRPSASGHQAGSPRACPGAPAR